VRGAGREVHLRQESEERTFDGVDEFALVQRPFEHVFGQRRLTAREMQRGERTDGVLVLLQALQQLRSFLEPPLPEPQIGEPIKAEVR